MESKKEKVEENNDVQKFSKEAFLKSNEYLSRKDLVTTLLDENTLYSKNEVNSLIEKYLKKEMK